jgi:fluoride exporter
MTKYLMVGMGGCLGSILRFWVGGAIDQRVSSRFPFGTFVINLTGSFLLGLIATVLTENAHWNPNWRYLVPIGFIGAYTTFSTFEFETFRSMESGLILVAMLNVILSVSLGFLGVWLGVITGRALA